MIIKKVLMTFLALIILSGLVSGAVSAITLFPYTDVTVQDSNLKEGDILYLIGGGSSITLLSANGGSEVYFPDDNLVAGTYSKDTAGFNTNYIVSYPDVNLKISQFGKPTSYLNGNTVSSRSGLNFTGTPLIDGYTLDSLRFTTPSGGSTPALGNIDSMNHNSNWDGNVFYVENLENAGVSVGTWKVQAVVSGEFIDGKKTYKGRSSYSFTVATLTESITANKDKVIRGNSFLVTIRGTPQDKVTIIYDTAEIHPLAGQGFKEVTGGFEIILGNNGYKTIQFDTNSNTDENVYTIKAKFDEIDSEISVKIYIEKGKITIHPLIYPAYYKNNEVTISGINTASGSVYLYVKGVNMPLQEIPVAGGGYATTSDSPIKVSGHNLEGMIGWYKTFTFADSFDEGQYSIYAVEKPYTVVNHIVQDLDAYEKDYSSDNIEIKLKEQFVEAKVIADVTSDDKFVDIIGHIDGIDAYLMVYIIGDDYLDNYIISTERDGTFSLKLNKENFVEGKYYVIIQHPMNDNQFNVQPGSYIPSASLKIKDSNGYKDFSKTNSKYDIYSFETLTVGSSTFLVYKDILEEVNTNPASETAEGICDLLDESYVDDIYAKVNFTVVQSSPTTVSDKILIKQGWNFISVPKTLASSNNTAEKLFSSIDTDNHAILGYNAQTKDWEQINKDTYIAPMTGYWIYSKTAGTINLNYPSNPSTPPSKDVYKGWNAVGLSAKEQTSAGTTFARIKWGTAIEWNTALGDYNTAIVNGVNSPEKLLTPGNGIWVYAEENGTMQGLTA